jgi:hypothetical protein
VTTGWHVQSFQRLPWGLEGCLAAVEQVPRVEFNGGLGE